MDPDRPPGVFPDTVSCVDEGADAATCHGGSYTDGREETVTVAVAPDGLSYDVESN